MEFPRDINNMIAAKLDIDTRRAYNIYSKIKCPSDMIAKLESVFNKVKKNEEGDVFYIELQCPTSTYEIIRMIEHKVIVYEYISHKPNDSSFQNITVLYEL